MPPLPDDHLWSKAEAQNQIELLMHFILSPLADFDITNEVVWVRTGIDDNTYNGICCANIHESTADEVIQTTLSHFTEGQHPFLWYVDENSQAPSLGQRLEEQGCIRLPAGVCMALNLDNMNTIAKTIPGLTVKRVETPTELAQWSSVYNQDPQREALFTSLGLTGEKRLRHYLALLDGEPVGTSSAFWGSESVGLYHVEVIPEARKQGIGTAIVLAPLMEARAAGYLLAVLGPSPEAQSMYKRIGFELLPQYGTCYTMPMHE